VSIEDLLGIIGGGLFVGSRGCEEGVFVVFGREFSFPEPASSARCLSDLKTLSAGDTMQYAE
jgi:hypothetical protein